MNPLSSDPNTGILEQVKAFVKKIVIYREINQTEENKNMQTISLQTRRVLLFISKLNRVNSFMDEQISYHKGVHASYFHHS